MSKKPKPVSDEEYELNGRRYRKRIYENGYTLDEPIESILDWLRMIGQLAAMVAVLIGFTTGWIFATHAIFKSSISYAAIIPTHIVAAFIIAWATILFGGMSESKRIAVTIPLVCAPLATLLIVGFARAISG